MQNHSTDPNEWVKDPLSHTYVWVRLLDRRVAGIGVNARPREIGEIVLVNAGDAASMIRWGHAEKCDGPPPDVPAMQSVAVSQQAPALRRKRGRPPSDEKRNRRGVINNAAGLIEEAYAEYMNGRLDPPNSWQEQGKPKLSYLQMYRHSNGLKRKHFRKLILDERYNYTRRK